jgi:sec-independent protein translocase protein TatC
VTSHAGRRQSTFQRAADGQMTLIEHIRELRSRLFKAVLAIVIFMSISLFFAERVLSFLTQPYCDFVTKAKPGSSCEFSQAQMLESFTVTLQVALYMGLLVSAPIWLYQLWAFIAPGLHRRERRYTYLFAAVAAPLFILGAVLAFEVIHRSLPFLLGLNNQFTTIVNIGGYFDFVTKMMLYFGIGFLFPVLIMGLNMVAGRRLPHVPFRGRGHADPGPVQHDHPRGVHVGALLPRGRRGVPERSSQASAQPLR